MKNEQIKGNVQLLKVDQDGKKKLEGAVFILADAKGMQYMSTQQIKMA